MSSKEESFWYKLGVFLMGCVMSPLAIFAIVPTVAWLSFWGAKISVALPSAFGWPLLTFTQIACLYFVGRLFNSVYDGHEVKNTPKYMVWVVASPVILWLSVMAFIWLDS